jgi:hypothetical protein
LWAEVFIGKITSIQAKNGVIPEKSKRPFQSAPSLRFLRASDGVGLGECELEELKSEQYEPFEPFKPGPEPFEL